MRKNQIITVFSVIVLLDKERSTQEKKSIGNLVRDNKGRWEAKSGERIVHKRLTWRGESPGPRTSEAGYRAWKVLVTILQLGSGVRLGSARNHGGER